MINMDLLPVNLVSVVVVFVIFLDVFYYLSGGMEEMQEFLVSKQLIFLLKNAIIYQASKTSKLNN